MLIDDPLNSLVRKASKDAFTTRLISRLRFTMPGISWSLRELVYRQMKRRDQDYEQLAKELPSDMTQITDATTPGLYESQGQAYLIYYTNDWCWNKFALRFIQDVSKKCYGLDVQFEKRVQFRDEPAFQTYEDVQKQGKKGTEQSQASPASSTPHTKAAIETEQKNPSSSASSQSNTQSDTQSDSQPNSQPNSQAMQQAE